jgi:hypothetical protein
MDPNPSMSTRPLPEPSSPTPGQRAGFGDIDGLKKGRRTSAAGQYGRAVPGDNAPTEWSRSVPEKGARAAFFAGRNEIIFGALAVFVVLAVAFAIFG